MCGSTPCAIALDHPGNSGLCSSSRRRPCSYLGLAVLSRGGPRPFIRVESRFVNIAMTGAERQARKIARLKEQAGAARGLVGSTGLMAAIHRRVVHTA